MEGFSHFSGRVTRSFKNFVILNISQTSEERHANNRSKSKDIPLLCWRLPHPCLVCHFLLTLVLAAVLLRNGVPSPCGSTCSASWPLHQQHYNASHVLPLRGTCCQATSPLCALYTPCLQIYMGKNF